MARSLHTSTVAMKTSSCSLRTVIIVNQFSVYGEITDSCNELSEDLRASWKSEAPDHLETMEIPTGPSIAETQATAQQRWNLVQEYERKLEQLSEDQKLSKLCSDACLKLVETGQYFYTLDTEEGQQMQHLCREYTMTRNESQEYENRSSLEHSLLSRYSIQCWSSGSIFVSIQCRFLG